MRSRIIILVSALLALSVFGVVSWAAAATTNFNVTANDMSAYLVDGVKNPTLTLTRGQTYTFTVNSGFMFHPFYVTTARGAVEANSNQFSQGVSNNGAATGVITFAVPATAPATLFYQCGFHEPMGGALNIISAAASVPTPAPSVGVLALSALAAALLVLALVSLRGRARVPN